MLDVRPWCSCLYGKRSGSGDQVRRRSRHSSSALSRSFQQLRHQGGLSYLYFHQRYVFGSSTDFASLTSNWLTFPRSCFSFADSEHKCSSCQKGALVCDSEVNALQCGTVDGIAYYLDAGSCVQADGCQEGTGPSAECTLLRSSSTGQRVLTFLFI